VAKVKLLLADKAEIFREGLAKLLEGKHDIEVVSQCRTGLEAVESAHKHQPDVVLMDIELSECSGIEAAQRIHERLPKTGIIMLANTEADASLISAVKAGARAYLSKDISVENLARVVILVAEGGVIVSPPMAARMLEEFNFLEEHRDVVNFASVTYLTKREKAVLSLVAQGFTNREIATSLVISESTVKVHVRNVMVKFHAHTRQQAVALARRKGAI